MNPKAYDVTRTSTYVRNGNNYKRRKVRALHETGLPYKILVCLRDKGPMRMEFTAAAIGSTPTKCSSAIQRLVDRGYAVRIPGGYYQYAKGL